MIPLTFGIKVGTEVASALVNAVWGDLGNGGNLEKVFDDIVQKNKPLAIASKISGKIRDLLPIVINIYRIAKNIKEKHKNGESISIDDFNLYKNMLLQKLAEYQTYLNLLIKKCDEAK